MTGEPESDTPGVDPEGVAARLLFGGRHDMAVRFAALLAGSAVERGLIGPREVPRLWDRHLLNCAAIAELIDSGSRVVDVGSGAGLPGLALAVARPDLCVVLVEPLQRRVVWLLEAVETLGLAEAVTVVRGRADEVHAEVGGADVVTARAVASLDRLATWCLPLVRPGGVLRALKGSSAAEELRAAEPTLRRLGARQWEIRMCGVGVLDVPTTVVEVQAGDPPTHSGSLRSGTERRGSASAAPSQRRRSGRGRSPHS